MWTVGEFFKEDIPTCYGKSRSRSLQWSFSALHQCRPMPWPAVVVVVAMVAEGGISGEAAGVVTLEDLEAEVIWGDSSVAASLAALSLPASQVVGSAAA
jgi:hypothetical protein